MTLYKNILKPPGIIEMYGGSTAPTGYILCDGSAVSRTTYAALFTAISTTYGVGDNSTTFNVPDFSGVFPKGAGTTARAAGKDANGNYYAGTLGTYLTDKLQGHIHKQKALGSRSITSAGGGTSWVVDPGSASADTGISVPITDATNGTPRTGLTTEPQSLGVSFIIKT